MSNVNWDDYVRGQMRWAESLSQAAREADPETARALDGKSRDLVLEASRLLNLSMMPVSSKG